MIRRGPHAARPGRSPYCGRPNVSIRRRARASQTNSAIRAVPVHGLSRRSLRAQATPRPRNLGRRVLEWVSAHPAARGANPGRWGVVPVAVSTRGTARFFLPLVRCGSTCDNRWSGVGAKGRRPDQARIPADIGLSCRSSVRMTPWRRICDVHGPGCRIFSRICPGLGHEAGPAILRYVLGKCGPCRKGSRGATAP